MKTDFARARGLVTFFTFVAAVGLVGCLLIGAFAVQEGAGVGLTALTLAPFVVAFMVQLLFCEIAKALFVTAEAAQAVRTDAREHHAALMKVLTENGETREAYKNVEIARSRSVEGRAATTPKTPSDAGRKPSPAIPAKPAEVVETFKGHRITKASGDSVRVGQRVFFSVEAAKGAINRGELD